MCGVGTHLWIKVTPPPHIIEIAVDFSSQSPCQSKRGAVIFKGEDLISVGYNDQPKPYLCDGSDLCKRSCSRTAIHAEQAALIGVNARGAEILHVKTMDGGLVESGYPSCIQCSKLMLASGIVAMWLFHKEGWKRYEMVEFHWLSSVGTDYMRRTR